MRIAHVRARQEMYELEIIYIESSSYRDQLEEKGWRLRKIER